MVEDCGDVLLSEARRGVALSTEDEDIDQVWSDAHLYMICRIL